MLKVFQSFIARMKANFARIARSTKNEVEEGDLHNDAYVLALEIGERRGRPIDFSDPEDADLVMRAVNLQNVRRGDWKMRRAVRIDQEPEEEEGGRMVDRLPARASSDPLVAILAKESIQDLGAVVAKSYSQISAYIVTFDYFDSDAKRICSHLAISDETLWKRVADAASFRRRQQSMFDEKERIPANFIPLRGQKYAAKISDTREAGQWAWNFEAE